MAQRKATPLTSKEREAATKKAKRAQGLKDISDLADANLATRPTEHWRKVTPEHKEVILYRCRAGDTVQTICNEMGISKGLVYSLAHFDEEFGRRMAEARIIGSYALRDAVLHIHEETDLSDARAKLKSDNYKWLLARENRQHYGEKLELTGKVESQVALPDWMFGQIIEGEALPPPHTDDSEDQPE